MKKDKLLLGSIYFLFHAALMVYKLFHPLWFYENGKLEYFAIGYAFMAIGGIISRTYFLLFANSMRISLLLSLSSVLFAGGILLSSITTSVWFSILGGLLAGLSSSTFMLVMYRISHMKQTKENLIVDVPQIINYAKFLGTIVATILVVVCNIGIPKMLFGLGISAIVASISCLPLLFINKKYEKFDGQELLHKDPFTISKLKTMVKEKPWLVCTMVALNLLGGIFIKMVLPFFPVMMMEKGFRLLDIGATTAFSYLLGGASHYLIHKLGLSRYKIKGFVLANLLMVGISVALGYMDNPIWISALIMMHFMSYGAYGIYCKIIEYELIPRNQIPIYKLFGENLFLTGNILGIVIGSITYLNLTIEHTLKTSAVLILSATLATIYFIYKHMMQTYTEYLIDQEKKRKRS